MTDTAGVARYIDRVQAERDKARAELVVLTDHLAEHHQQISNVWKLTEVWLAAATSPAEWEQVQREMARQVRRAVLGAEADGDGHG